MEVKEQKGIEDDRDKKRPKPHNWIFKMERITACTIVQAVV